MSCPEHSQPAKRQKTQPDTVPVVPWLFLLPMDIWPIVRDLAGAKEAAVWTLVCTHFRTVVTAAEFWAHFVCELKLEFESHRRILSLLAPVCQTPLHSLTIPCLSGAGQKKLVPLVTSIEVKELTLIGSVSPQIPRAFAAIHSLDLIQNKYTNACLQLLLHSASSLCSLRLEKSEITDTDLRAVLPKFTGLERLGLAECDNITDSALQVLTRLKALDLEDCRRISGRGLQNLQLQELNLHKRNYLTAEEARAAFPTLDKLERLSFCGFPESEFKLLTQIRALRHLDLLDCSRITGAALPDLYTLQLETFKVTLTCCSDRSVIYLLNFPALVELRLRDCNVLTSQDLLPLQACPKLSKLGLFECNAVQDLSVLRAFPVLADLSFDQCAGLDNKSVAGLQHCRSLRQIAFNLCEGITSIAALQQCRSLRKLFIGLMRRQIPRAEVQDFRQQRPEVDVSFI